MAGSPKKRARRILDGKPVADSHARGPAQARARVRSESLDPISDPLGAKAALVRCYFDVAMQGDDTPAAKLVLEAIESTKDGQFFRLFSSDAEAAQWLLENHDRLLTMAGNSAAFLPELVAQPVGTQTEQQGVRETQQAGGSSAEVARRETGEPLEERRDYGLPSVRGADDE